MDAQKSTAPLPDGPLPNGPHANSPHPSGPHANGACDNGAGANPMIVMVKQRGPGWRAAFLANLAASSNVRASAHAVNTPLASVYRARRDDPAFAARWRDALFEGYEHLEMEVLGVLRGAITDRKIDVANALRLLAAHRQTVNEMRTVAHIGNEQDVLDAIDAKIIGMKAEWEASEEAMNQIG